MNVVNSKISRIQLLIIKKNGWKKHKMREKKRDIGGREKQESIINMLLMSHSHKNINFTSHCKLQCKIYKYLEEQIAHDNMQTFFNLITKARTLKFKIYKYIKIKHMHAMHVKTQTHHISN